MAKVLLVEDDNNLREIYEARLQAEGYQIVSANDGEAALVVAKNEKPDLIISDVMMPKISGFEMLDILRNTDGLKDVKVIMLTALGQADDQARADKLGANRYLVKSQVTLEDIVKVSHELLDGEALAAPAATASTDTPAATTPAPAPEPVAEPGPATTPAATDSTTAQTSASEEATVQQQIENFVNTQPASPPPAAEPTTEAQSPEDAAANDASLSEAVNDLVADTEAQAAETPAPAAPPTEAEAPASEPAPEEAAPAEDGQVSHKKVIQPLDSEPGKSLDQLLAEEEAKEPVSTVPVVGSSEDEQPSGAPTPPPSTQAETSGPDKPFDPNSIAL